MAARKPALDRQVQVQVERIVDEGTRGCPPEEIERLAQEAAERHKGAPVQQYVPNLVYHEVKTKLSEAKR
jgi:hypothetical protein